MNQVHIVGQQVLHPVAEDGVRVAAAKLHQVIVAPRIDFRRDQLRSSAAAAAPSRKPRM